MINFKRVLGAICTVAATITGVAKFVELPTTMYEDEQPTVTTAPYHSQYVLSGRYSAEGKIFTDDGNVWFYMNDTLKNNEPLYVVFDDNATEDVCDDIIIDTIIDRQTAIYDELESELSKKFNVVRDGNTITISK